ncbi:unnamed protein product [Cochlearia groenlandica]
MLQFKPIFLGKVPRQVPCATTAQRCIRTNDLENVGRTARHHTFFEMLGNFSFGDYFKKEAIRWAWEISTVEFGLPVDRVWVSVYEEDDESFDIWKNEVGVPVERIKRMGEADNFWTSGPMGPCGPCSELYYDFYPERGCDDDVDLGDDTRFIEFYNLVFMEYNKTEDSVLEPLKQKNIDTGLGLERMAQILQKVPNNYETDLIFPIIQKVSDLANISYESASDQAKTSLKVIADHMRAIVYLISDGVSSSNIGRGYVVRRLIRRAVRKGKSLGIGLEGAFLPIVAEKVIEMSTYIDSDVKLKATRILEEIRQEELHFKKTLAKGEKLLDQKLQDALSMAEKTETKPYLSGKDAFVLYDTYGFPVEITAEVGEERGVSIDMNGFEVEMENQRRQSQAAHNVVKLSVEDDEDITKNIAETEFLGYDMLSARAVVKSLMVDGKSVIKVSEGSDVEILLDRTPFYAESGGQIADHGFLYLKNGENQEKAVVEVSDVRKSLKLFVHKGIVKNGSLEVGKEVEAEVDAVLRQRAKVHHTATHLLQSALKKVVGQETSQAGSLVAFDRLRFDFNFNRPLQDSELEEIEGLINKWIGDATLLETKVLPLADAKQAGAIAMFGEKYDENEVRVVEVPGVSMELCGGTHVSNTAEIRAFKIISEQGIASGIRRIEAVAGEAFIEYINSRDSQMTRLCSILKVKAEDVTNRVENLQEELRAARKEISDLRSKTAVYRASVMSNKAFTIGTSQTIRVLVESLDDTDADSLKSAAEHLVSTLEDPAAVVLGSCPDKDKVSLVAAFSPGVVSLGVQAGKFIGPIAKLCGGGGGGKPNFAQAGGRKPENLSSALEKAREDLVAKLSEKLG